MASCINGNGGVISNVAAIWRNGIIMAGNVAAMKAWLVMTES
jgi:hypothetical protein